MDHHPDGLTLTKEQMENMTKDKVIQYALRLLKKFEQNEVLKMPERNVLMRMASFFLSNMKRPNTAKKTKGKKPAKFLKWFNTEER